MFENEERAAKMALFFCFSNTDWSYGLINTESVDCIV